MKTIKYIILACSILTFCLANARTTDGDMAARVAQLEQKVNQLLEKTKQCSKQLDNLSSKMQKQGSMGNMPSKSMGSKSSSRMMEYEEAE